MNQNLPPQREQQMELETSRWGELHAEGRKDKEWTKDQEQSEQKSPGKQSRATCIYLEGESVEHCM